MHTTRVVIVSDGLLFEGVRTKESWTWREVGPALEQPRPALTTTDHAKRFINTQLDGAKLCKQDKAHCRKVLETLPVAALRTLETHIKRHTS